MIKAENFKKPIFVFGCCNSGTTVLWQALKGHKGLSGPDIEAQDIDDMPRIMRHFLGEATFRLWAHPKFKLAYYVTERDFNPNNAAKIYEIYGRYLIPGTRLVIKSPADTLRARLIQAYFPDAYFIAIVRNGYAVSEGIVRKRKLDPDRLSYKGLFTSIDEAAQQWTVANTIIVSHQKFLKRYIIVKYEDLVQKPKEVLLSILDFCGLDATDYPFPIFEQNLNEKQISRLTKYEIETITTIAAPILLHFEYNLLEKKLKWDSV
jgi:hypothetical protein